jgi:hypothetical protein
MLPLHGAARRPLDVLLDNRSDPESRAVLADLRLEYGERPGKLGVELWATDAAAADDAAADAADAADDATAADDAAAAADADDDATAADDAAAAADAAADADDDDDAADDAAAAATARGIPFLTKLLAREEDMTEGLTIVQTFTRYGYALTRIGWLRRDHGDEWSLHEARTLLRKDKVAWSENGLDLAASDGPGDRYRVSKPARLPVEYHRLLVPPTRPCNEEAWKKLCPRPKAWRTSTEVA